MLRAVYAQLPWTCVARRVNDQRLTFVAVVEGTNRTVL